MKHGDNLMFQKQIMKEIIMFEHKIKNNITVMKAIKKPNKIKTIISPF